MTSDGMGATSMNDAPDRLRWPSPMADRKARLELFGLALLSFVVCAVPVLRSVHGRDPLTGSVTDHIRNRYCAAKLLSQPVRSLTRPLLEIRQADPSRHGIASWGDTPCTQAGPVFFLVHAPFHWALDADVMTPERATALYVLLMLACAHLFLLVALGLDGVWPAALLLYPWITSTALMGLATPLSSLLGLLAFRDYAAQRHFRASLLLALAISSYNRWVVVLPGVLYLLAFAWRAEAVRDLRAHWGSRRGRALAIAGVIYLGWCLLTTGLVWWHRRWIPDPTSPMSQVMRYAVLLAFALALLRRRRSAVAAVGTSFGIFFASFRDVMLSWYIEPLIPLFALARSGRELLLWSALVVLSSQAFDGVPNLVETRVLLGWLFGSWARLL